MNPRVAGRLGTQVALNAQFYRNGELSSPFAIRRIDIYRGSVRPENLVDQIFIDTEPGDIDYPDPIVQADEGSYFAIYEAPDDLVPGDVYFDVWRFLGDDPGTVGLDDESLWLSQVGQFYLYDDVWIIDDYLSTLKIDFEPIDKEFRRGEIKNLELAIHLLPAYDYDWNKLVPLIPQLSPKITIKTNFDELIADQVDCKIGIRQGANRNSPYVIQANVDTRTLIRGSYKYYVTMQLGDQKIVSEYYWFTVR